ncbi:MAG: hypothetical protein KF878_09870 [Planctomycetes bacterium]|nr:hypothetical protein [Planctomycetota bacterium]
MTVSHEAYRHHPGAKVHEALDAATATTHAEPVHEPRPTMGRPTAYVSARFSAAEQTCKVMLLYRDETGAVLDLSDEVTLSATVHQEGDEASRYLSRGEPFDLAGSSYEVLVTEPPGSGDVDIYTREVGP